MNNNDAATQIYLDEAREMLADLEEGLLLIEENPNDLENVSRVFRAMHTIKGSGAMFGFAEIARFTHDVETVLDRVRNGAIPVTHELLTLVLQAKDHIHSLLQEPPAGSPEARLASDRLLQHFRSYLEEPVETSGQGTSPAGTEPVPTSAEGGAASAQPKESAQSETYWIRYKPSPGAFMTGAKPLGLVEELLDLGAGVTVHHGGDIPSLEHYAPERVYSWWDILLVTSQGENAIKDVFIFVEDEDVVEVHRVFDRGVRHEDLQEFAVVFREHPLQAASSIIQWLDDKLKVKTGNKDKTAATSGARPQAARTASQPATSIRVDAGRLDNLVNMVGEMVILQARLSIMSKTLRNSVVTQIAEEMERLTAQMRENALGMRMLPIGTVYGALKRMVRDVSTSLGKDVDFITEGAETELDKTVIDQLKDPLMHILRNALDHGVEAPQTREQKGKPAKGTVRLAARHSRGDVLIEIHDDGRGVDPEKLRRKAVERELIAPDASLEKKEALNLLFLPGFSTAAEVTDLSGRGVGMDVVKRSIDAIRGSVDIESEPGKGASIYIRLPLTLAIIDGLNVSVGRESYILPLVNIESCQERFLDEAPELVETMEYMGNMIPCVSLRKLLHTPGEAPDYERIIVVTVDEYKVGLSVDGVIGRQQAVIKSLSEMYEDVDFISGTTVNGHGSISLILDVPQLVRRAMRLSENGRHKAA